MARDPRHFKLGVFVIGGIVVTLGALFALFARSWFEEAYPLYCYFEENVQGLEAGSDIKYRGVSVGTVTNVALQPVARNGPRGMREGAVIRVECEVYPDRLGADPGLFSAAEDLKTFVGELVASGLRVSIAWKDITGQKYLNLDYYPLHDHPIPDLGIRARQPYIPAAVERSFQDIQRDLATTLANLSQINFKRISTQLEDLLALTTQRIEALDTQSLSGHLEETLIAVRQFAQDENGALRQAIDRMNEITISMDAIAKKVQEVVSAPEFDQAVADLEQTAGSLRETTATLQKRVPEMLDGMDRVVGKAETVLDDAQVPETTGAIRDAAKSVGGAGRDIAVLREDLQRVLRDLGAMSRNVSRLARYLEENPDALLSGKRDGRGTE